MKYLGQMKNQSKELSGGPFEHFHSRFKAPIFHFKAALLIHREEFGYTFWSVRLISSCKICSNTFSFQNTAAVCPVAPRWCQNIMPEKFQTCTKRIGRIVAPRTSSHINYGVSECGPSGGSLKEFIVLSITVPQPVCAQSIRFMCSVPSSSTETFHRGFLTRLCCVRLGRNVAALTPTQSITCHVRLTWVTQHSLCCYWRVMET